MLWSKPRPTRQHLGGENSPRPIRHCHRPSHFVAQIVARRSSVLPSGTSTASPSTTTSNPCSQALQPVVSVTYGLPVRLMAFCSAAPVQKWMASSSQTAGSGVTWGRPSPRTVEIQKSSAASIAPRVSSQPVATAPGSLNRWSRTVTGVRMAGLSSIAIGIRIWPRQGQPKHLQAVEMTSSRRSGSFGTGHHRQAAGRGPGLLHMAHDDRFPDVPAPTNGVDRRASTHRHVRTSSCSRGRPPTEEARRGSGGGNPGAVGDLAARGHGNGRPRVEAARGRSSHTGLAGHPTESGAGHRSSSGAQRRQQDHPPETSCYSPHGRRA